MQHGVGSDLVVTMDFFSLWPYLLGLTFLIVMVYFLWISADTGEAADWAKFTTALLLFLAVIVFLLSRTPLF
jgi:hypothetical protein